MKLTLFALLFFFTSDRKNKDKSLSKTGMFVKTDFWANSVEVSDKDSLNFQLNQKPQY